MCGVCLCVVGISLLQSFLYHPPLCFLTQGLLVNLEYIVLTTVAANKPHG